MLSEYSNSFNYTCVEQLLRSVLSQFYIWFWGLFREGHQNEAKLVSWLVRGAGGSLFPLSQSSIELFFIQL